MARIRFPGSQRPQRTQIAAMRQPQQEKDWYKDPNQLLAWVRLAEALGSKEGLAARGIREIRAQMAESRLEEAGRPQGPVEPSVEEQMGARDVSEGAPEQAQPLFSSQPTSRFSPPYLVDDLLLQDQAAARALPTIPSASAVAGAGQEYKSPELQQKEALAAQQAQAGGLWAPLLERQRAAQAEREARRGQLEELGIKTVGDVTGAVLDYYQDHGQLPNEVVRDAWMALEDAVENDPTYIREGLTVRDARNEMMQTLRLLREGREPDELREVNLQIAKMRLARMKQKDREKLDKAGRTFKPSTSLADFKKQFKMDEWQKPTTEREDQFVEISDGETLRITYGSDPNGAISQLQYLSSRLRSGSSAQKKIQSILTKIGTQLTQTERGTAGQEYKEDVAEDRAIKREIAAEEKARKREEAAKAKELKKAQDNLDKATTARTAYMNSQNLVAVDGKEPVMTPQQNEKVRLLNAAIKRARDARDKLLEEGPAETSPSGFTMGPVKTTPVKTTKE